MLYRFDMGAKRDGGWPRLSESAASRIPRGCVSACCLLLAYYAVICGRLAVAPAWVALGLVLAEVGFRRQLPDLRAQGYLSLACAFVTVFFVNLNADATVLGISMRLLSVAPVALALYYEYFRLAGLPIEYRLERRFHLAASAAWCGTISVAALLRFEVSPDWVAAGWALLALTVDRVAYRGG